MNITEEWLKEKSACREGRIWWRGLKETDGLKVVKALIKDKKLDWANWSITHIMSYEQYVSYAVYAAEQVIEIYENKNQVGKTIISGYQTIFFIKINGKIYIKSIDTGPENKTYDWKKY